MKRLLKLCLVLLISAFSIQVIAQTFAVKGGLNLANMLDKDNDFTYSDDYSMLTGFHIGVTMDYPLTDLISLETGLLFDTKGSKYEFSEFGFDVSSKTNLLYVDIPITAKATHDLNDDVKIFGTLGPYIGIGLSGKVKAETNGEEDETDIEWGSDENEDHLKRFDYGLTFGAGAEVQQFLLHISYDLGLANIHAVQENDSKINNRVLRISVGYKFSQL